MGKYTSGINGPITGKVGAVVGSSWKGIPYLKAKYSKRTKNITEKELANRKRFAMAQAWLAPLLDFVREGFKGYSPLSEGFNAAKSYLMKNAMEGELFDITINPALVRVSSGDLPLPADITVQLKNENTIEFTWNPKCDRERLYDQAMLLVYDIQHSKAYQRPTGDFRKTGKYDLTLEDPFPKDRNYHIYFAMLASDRSSRSNSVYLGTINT